MPQRDRPAERHPGRKLKTATNPSRMSDSNGPLFQKEKRPVTAIYRSRLYRGLPSALSHSIPQAKPACAHSVRSKP